MGDWADAYEAFGYDISYIPHSAYARKKKRGVKVQLTLTKEQKAKYQELGGAAWVKRMLKEQSK